MGIYLNRGRDDFERAINSEIYVDKTEMIALFSRAAETEQAYICLSRPRRFGKTIAANMVATYFEKGADARDIFENRKLGKLPDWDDKLGKYDVIRIDVADAMANYQMPGDALEKIKNDIKKELYDSFGEYIPESALSVADYLAHINDKTGAKFVIIIDEWDAFYRNDKLNTEVQSQYIDFLRSLFKGNRSKKFTALAYITGILPIKKYNNESALNNFREFSMLRPARFAKYIGFSSEEVKELCDEYDMDYKDVCDWYDGYIFGKNEHIFGPNSVVQSMLDGSCSNYWSQTVAFNSLASYISMNFDGLKHDIIQLLADIHVGANVYSYENDMTSFKTHDDVLALLVHLGYLCYDAENETVYIPNKEVRQIFERSIKPSGWSEIVEAMDNSESLLKALLSKEETRVAEAIDKCHRENTSILKYNDENSLAMVLNLAFYSARKEYIVVREMPSGYGFADLVYIPKGSVDKPAMILELKWNKSANTAIDQIKANKYPDCMKDYKGEIVLAGISYDKESKKHECVIEYFPCGGTYPNGSEYVPKEHA